MKKTILSTVLALASVSTAVACNVDKQSSTMFEMEVKLYERGSLLTSTKGLASNKCAYRIAKAATQTYIAETKRDGDKLVLVPGKLTTGLSLLLEPSLLEHGDISVKVDFSDSILEAVNRVNTDELSIDTPLVSANGWNTHVLAQDGQNVSVDFGPREGFWIFARPRYSLELVATKVSFSY
jgi:hypothetical protein